MQMLLPLLRGDFLMRLLHWNKYGNRRLKQLTDIIMDTKKSDFIWMAGGPQGSGVDSSANIFARTCCYGGLHVYGKREYSSNIKGLHSYFQIRVSSEKVGAMVDRVDLLCTFDAES